MQYKKCNQQVNMQQGQYKQNLKTTITNLFTLIQILQRERYSSSSAFIRLLNLQYKRQDRASISNSDKILLVLREDKLCVKRIIVV